LQKKFDLFGEYSNFQEARIFQLPDSSYVLEILYRSKGKLFKDRKSITAQDIQELRQSLITRLQREQQKSTLDQNGRTKLLIASTLLSLGYYGWVVPEALNINNEKLGVATYMFSAGAGFIIPYLATKNRSVTNAAATLAVYGATRGILHGHLLAHTLNEQPSSRQSFTTSMLVSISESFLDYQLATRRHYSTGRVETMGVTGDFGLLLGAYFGIFNHYFNDDIGRKASASMLAGSGLGFWTGKLLSDKYTYSRGDARVLESITLLGAYIPLSLVRLTNTNNEKIYIGSSFLGTLAGIGLAHYWLRDKNFSYSHGVFVELGELTGGLLGFGLAYIATPDNVDRSKIYMNASAIGATAGFLLMYKSFVSAARIKSDKLSSFNFSLHPESLLGLMIKNEQKELRLPVASLSIRF